MFTVYIFCVKMHERYLFPVLLCLLLTYVFTKEKRFLLLFAGTSTVHFLNVAYVLYLNNAYISPTSIQILFLSALHVLLYIYMLYITYRCFISEKALRPLPAFKTQKAASAEQHTKPAAAPEFSLITDKNHNVRLTRVDLLCIAVVTLLYGIVAFTNLGDHETANTTWTPQNGESAVFETDDAYSEIFYLPGIAPADNGIGQRVGVSMRVEVSDDGENWTLALDNTEGSVYAWKSDGRARDRQVHPHHADLRRPRDQRVRAQKIGRHRLRDADGGARRGLRADRRAERRAAVPELHELDVFRRDLPRAHGLRAHSRLEPYENTHPPLGKLIISLGIRMFGMNPFGWRFMGTLFGVLMLPILYHLLKRLFGSTFLCTAGTVLFAFDFMHYVQTRIATDRHVRRCSSSCSCTTRCSSSCRPT